MQNLYIFYYLKSCLLLQVWEIILSLQKDQVLTSPNDPTCLLFIEAPCAWEQSSIILILFLLAIFLFHTYHMANHLNVHIIARVFLVVFYLNLSKKYFVLIYYVYKNWGISCICASWCKNFLGTRISEFFGRFNDFIATSNAAVLDIAIEYLFNIFGKLMLKFFHMVQLYNLSFRFYYFTYFKN